MIINHLAVDADIVAYRCSFACEAEPVSVLHRTIDDFLNYMAVDSGVSDMTLYLTGKDNFRYKVATTRPYKGNRKKSTKPEHLQASRDYMVKKYKAMVVDGYEADDAIATHMTIDPQTAHCGIDKDIKQIAGWHYNFVKKEWDEVTPDEAALLLWRQVLSGDSTDNIPGLKGIGAKKAERAVQYPDKAEEDAFHFYKVHMFNSSWQEVSDYFVEQTQLIRLKTDLELPDHKVTITKFFAEEEGWMGE